MRLGQILVSLMLCIGALAQTARERRDYEIQRGFLSVFDDRPLPSACDSASLANGKTGSHLVSNGTRFALHRKDHLAFDRKEVSGLTIRPQAGMVFVSGTEARSYAIELCASAGKPGGPDAGKRLDEIRLSRNGDTLSVAAPEHYDPEQPSITELRIAMPSDLPVTVQGERSSIEVRGVAGPIKLTTAGVIWINGTSGSVDADATGYGPLYFAAERGQVRLTAAQEINLKLPATSFAGTLHATANHVVRVMLPEAFRTPFEAQVRKASDFVCRAAFCDQIKHLRRNGVESFQFGTSDAALKFVSTDGHVVIDSFEGLRQAEDKSRRDAATQEAEEGREATRINELAGSVHSEADARQYVDLLWKLFEPEASKWIARPMLNRVAQAEYAAVSRSQVIPEARVAISFNRFAQQIGAPAWAQISPEEVRNLRDADLVTAKALWTAGQRSIWTMPNTYHADPAGKLAPGCRAVEALKLLYDLHQSFANALYARERVRQGLLLSQVIKRRAPSAQRPPPEAQLAEARSDERENEFRRIQAEYVRQHGTAAYVKLLREMFEGVLL